MKWPFVRFPVGESWKGERWKFFRLSLPNTQDQFSSIPNKPISISISMRSPTTIALRCQVSEMTLGEEKKKKEKARGLWRSCSSQGQSRLLLSWLPFNVSKYSLIRIQFGVCFSNAKWFIVCPGALSPAISGIWVRGSEGFVPRRKAFFLFVCHGKWKWKVPGTAPWRLYYKDINLWRKHTRRFLKSGPVWERELFWGVQWYILNKYFLDVFYKILNIKN